VQVPLDEKSRKANLASLHELSTKALCCLGFAYKEDLGEFGAFDGEFHPAHEQVPHLYLSSSFLFYSWLFLVLFLILLASFCYLCSWFATAIASVLDLPLFNHAIVLRFSHAIVYTKHNSKVEKLEKQVIYELGGYGAVMPLCCKYGYVCQTFFCPPVLELCPKLWITWFQLSLCCGVNAHIRLVLNCIITISIVIALAMVQTNHSVETA
jgi:hypothetical protein